MEKTYSSKIKLASLYILSWLSKAVSCKLSAVTRYRLEKDLRVFLDKIFRVPETGPVSFPYSPHACGGKGEKADDILLNETLRALVRLCLGCV